MSFNHFRFSQLPAEPDKAWLPRQVRRLSISNVVCSFKRPAAAWRKKGAVPSLCSALRSVVLFRMALLWLFPVIILRLLWYEERKHILLCDIIQAHHFRYDSPVRSLIRTEHSDCTRDLLSLVTFLHRFAHIDTPGSTSYSRFSFIAAFRKLAVSTQILL